MVILFLLFLIQFSVACACLGVNGEQQEQLAEQGWRRVNNDTRQEVQESFVCCGFKKDISPSDPKMGHPSCDAIQKKCCPDSSITDCECKPCMEELQDTINYAFKLCGWIGLFFSFTELVGIAWTRHYRNQSEPEKILMGNAVFPSTHNYTY